MNPEISVDPALRAQTPSHASERADPITLGMILRAFEIEPGTSQPEPKASDSPLPESADSTPQGELLGWGEPLDPSEKPF